MQATSESDLLALWQSLGVERGDVLVVHSFLPVLGKIAEGPRTVIRSLIQAVGSQGHIVVPTFTYSIFREEIYDPELSPSQVGVLGEYVRRLENSVRSLDPAFSMASVGPDSTALMERTSSRSFGEDTIYERLCERKAKALLLGVGYEKLPLFMHLERLLEVPYRTEMTFRGKTRLAGTIRDDSLVHFARIDPSRIANNRTRIGSIIDSHGEVRVEPKSQRIRVVPFQSVTESVMGAFGSDPYILVDVNQGR